MSDIPKPCILAVDDSRVMRRAMTKVLGKEYDVIEAEHGEDAWTYLLNKTEIQVVFTDLNMPYLDGFGLLAKMRECDDPRLQEMPVIIITGKDDDDETKQRALDNGASDFITKPFDSVQLLARAKTHVRFEQTSRMLTETSDRLEQQAAVDTLTGLGGKHYFAKAGEEHIAYIKRNGGQLVLLRLDIDNFNQVFISCGKDLANEILIKVGEALSKSVRKEDMIARIGLSKFAMMMRDISIEEAGETAHRILEEINSLSFENGSARFKVSTSIGILEPQISDESNIGQLVKEAEIYLDKASKAGGNQVAVKSLQKIPAEHEISVPTALRLLEFGHAENIKPHIPALIKQLLPLLTYIAENMEGEGTETIKAIKDKLQT